MKRLKRPFPKRAMLRLSLFTAVALLLASDVGCSQIDYPLTPYAKEAPRPIDVEQIVAPPPTPTPLAEFAIRVAYDTPGSPYPTADAWEKWKAEVERNGKGRIKVILYPKGQLYKEREGGVHEILKAVQDGSIQLGQISTVSAVDVTRMEAITLFPYLLSYDQLPDFFRSGPWYLAGREANKAGVTEVSQWYSGEGLVVMSKDKQWKTAADLKGMLIRPADPVVNADAIFRLGALPSQFVSTGDAAAKAKEGVLDGVVGSYTWWQANLGDTMKYGLDSGSGMGNIVYHIEANLKWWDELPPEIRTILSDAFANASDYTYKAAPLYEQSLKQQLTKSGHSIYTLSPAESAKWQELGRTVWNDNENWIGVPNWLNDVAAWSAEWKREHGP